MALDLEHDGLLLAAIAGLPKVAEVISTIPEEQRSRVLDAAEQSYLRVAHELGYDGDDARQLVSAVMLRLRLDHSPEGTAKVQVD